MATSLGYHLNKRDGLRYPSYVRMDSEGRRIRGDKFIVMPNGKCCFPGSSVPRNSGWQHPSECQHRV